MKLRWLPLFLLSGRKHGEKNRSTLCHFELSSQFKFKVVLIMDSFCSLPRKPVTDHCQSSSWVTLSESQSSHSICKDMSNMSWASLILSRCSSLLPLFFVFFLSSSSLFLFFFLSLFSFSILSNSSRLLLSSISLSPSPFFPVLPFFFSPPFLSYLSFQTLPLFFCLSFLSNSSRFLVILLSPILFLSFSFLFLPSFFPFPPFSFPLFSLPSLPQFLFPRISFPLSFHCL